MLYHGSGIERSLVEAFCRLYKRGLVYREEYMVNWAPLLQMAASDLEVEYVSEEGNLYHFKYMVEDSNSKLWCESLSLLFWECHMLMKCCLSEVLLVATTRPETICGECSCVNPEDDRYKYLVAKNVVVPLSGGMTESLPTNMST